MPEENKKQSCSCKKEGVVRETEIDAYAKQLRLRIKHQIGILLPNKDHRYASAIVEEFLRAARKYVHIFCGHLGEDVYASRYLDFEDAVERGIDVKVITYEPYEALQSRELAAYLYEKGCLRWDGTRESVPHFIVADGLMFRLETDSRERTAVVCAYAQEYEFNRNLAARLDANFDKMWREASCQIPSIAVEA